MGVGRPLTIVVSVVMMMVVFVSVMMLMAFNPGLVFATTANGAHNIFLNE
jgi:uncharacterized membrane protein (DUF485 family)